MRVICIDGVKPGSVGTDNLNIPKVFHSHQCIYEGECYNVSDVKTFKGEEYFCLIEKPQDCAYKSKRFIPLSTQDEQLKQDREVFEKCRG